MYRLKYNTLTSAMAALQQLVTALRLVKGQKEMAGRATPAKLTDFALNGKTLAKLLLNGPANRIDAVDVVDLLSWLPRRQIVAASTVRRIKIRLIIFD
ncbi:hypothetical protein PCASD_09803 [Puccinia coronata f. sp. avenae]|uniref:Uncharacterized protein n=1 Tax=Puccinia coronata f. sp. avenae TaxID=200324 RepID=A0A2N5U9U7_9BASI|nr:hypothetical protein PCASD_09803 [Puccinia coronata f. sp. avenae]